MKEGSPARLGRRREVRNNKEIQGVTARWLYTSAMVESPEISDDDCGWLSIERQIERYHHQTVEARREMGVGRQANEAIPPSSRSSRRVSAQRPSDGLFVDGCR